MRIKMSYRVLISVIVFAAALIYALPSLLSDEHSLQRYLPDNKIQLGLDLQGGVSLTLGVDMDRAFVNTLEQMGNSLRAQAEEEGIVIVRPQAVGTDKLQFYLLDGDREDHLRDLIERMFYQELTIEETEEVAEGRWQYTLGTTSEFEEELQDKTIEQALTVIRNRVDEFGVAEPDIRRMEDNRVQVQLPGIEEGERAIELVQQTAHLQFKLVDEDTTVQEAQEGRVPPGSSVYEMQRRQPDGSYETSPIVLEERTLMTGEHIADAGVAFDRHNRPYVSLNFDRQGARIFERLTGEHINRRMAIVLDDVVYSAPTIQEEIRGGRASITGDFSSQEAHDLAIVLRAGSLPAPVDVLQERSVGASLGQQSIEQGVTALIVGGLLVLLLAIAYYGIGGLIADLMLGFNLLVIVSVLAGFGATLTLPGIAGIILLVGIAMDASILIFERIREEFRRGMTPIKAVNAGFSRSALTIMDANVTTILAALILYNFGTGPIQGFAITISIGILASMFTAIFVSRALFELWLRMRRTKDRLSL